MKLNKISLLLVAITSLQIAHAAPVEKTRLASSSAGGYTYAYAPSMVKIGDTTYSYYCSSGTVGWDTIRLTKSKDLKNWTQAMKVLDVGSNVPNGYERAACDPNIVYYNAGDGAYYYLFYSNNTKDVATNVMVARSASPDGPFLKWTNRGTWEEFPSDPISIVTPFKSYVDGTPNERYGAGQQMVIARDGKLIMWYNDDTEIAPDAAVYVRTASHPAFWSAPVKTNLINTHSPDIKWDPVSNEFVAIIIDAGHLASARLVTRSSKDGINWSAPREVIPASPDGQNANFPRFGHNVGVVSDVSGNLINRQNAFVAFGAPKDLSPSYTSNDCSVSPAPYCWGYWDLYGLFADASLRNPAPPASSSLPVVTNTQKTFSSAQAKEALWPASSALDGNPTTVYSSYASSAANNPGGLWLAAWFPSRTTINKIVLTPRRAGNGTELAMPKKFNVYVTAADNSKWLQSNYLMTARGSQYVLYLPRSYDTYGVQLIPTELGKDDFGNYYFQLADMSAE